MEDRLYEPSLLQLRRIVDTTGAIIVVSSAWRQIITAYKHLQDWLKKYGMEIYDKTPYVGGTRGDDITEWFNLHPNLPMESCRYVILDDDSDMGEHMDHLVKTNYMVGLAEKEADECIRRLTAHERRYK